MIIYIIGITGVGKSVIGKHLARKIGINFIDLDAYVELREGMNATELFQISEQCFRDCETNALKSINLEQNHVIATGGGIITRDENIQYMKEHGIVIQIHRKISDIVRTINVKKRPLLSKDKNKLYQLYEERKNKYKIARDIYVDCSNKRAAIKILYDEVINYEKNKS